MALEGGQESYRGLPETRRADPEIDDDFEIVEHEHAHAVVLAAGGDSSFVEEEESSRLSPGIAGISNMEPFLDQFSGMINHGNLKAILGDQEHM